MSTTLESKRSENAALESLSSARNDLKVIQANDPATTGLLHPLLDFKGFLTSDSGPPNRALAAESEDVARLSPMEHGHFNFPGIYSFSLADEVNSGHLRPLRNPEEIEDLVA